MQSRFNGSVRSVRTVSRLPGELSSPLSDESYGCHFRALCRVDLLILDDWDPDRLSPDRLRDLMELVEERSGRRSMVAASQLPLSSWHDVIGEPTFADAILYRLVSSSYRLELDGPSLRGAGEDVKAEKFSAPRPSLGYSQ